MAILQKTREKAGMAVSIIIALALLSFIIDPQTLETAFNAMSSRNDVGVINGKTVSYLDFQQDVIDRVMFLIANHHTYKSIESLDLQILVEADFLVNTCEDNLSRETAVKLGEKVFKTNTGKQLLKNLF